MEAGGGTVAVRAVYVSGHLGSQWALHASMVLTGVWLVFGDARLTPAKQFLWCDQRLCDSALGSLLLHHFATNRVECARRQSIAVECTSACNPLGLSSCDHNCRALKWLSNHVRRGSIPSSGTNQIHNLPRHRQLNGMTRGRARFLQRSQRSFRTALDRASLGTPVHTLEILRLHAEFRRFAIAFRPIQEGSQPWHLPIPLLDPAVRPPTPFRMLRGRSPVRLSSRPPNFHPTRSFGPPAQQWECRWHFTPPGRNTAACSSGSGPRRFWCWVSTTRS